MKFKFISSLLAILCIQTIEAQVALLENTSYTSHADILDGGQSFTLKESIFITEIQMHVRAFSGGSDFRLFITSYDPWNHIHGTELFEAYVYKEEFSGSSGGTWVSVLLPDGLALGNGIYAINFDTISSGGSSGYNGYAMTSNNVILGGRRILQPSSNNSYTNHHDLAIRIIGFGSSNALLPTTPEVPNLDIIGLSTRSWTSSRFLDYRHSSESGFVYFRWSSENLSDWNLSSISALGTGSDITGSASVLLRSKSFIRIEAVNLGDTVGRKK